MADEVFDTRVFLRALPPALFQAVQDVAQDLSDSPNFWVPREALEAGGPGATPAEAAVAALLPLVCPLLPPDWSGAEYWVQIYAAGRGLAFHFDKDEHAMASQRAMVNPILSSVFYLTGDPSSAEVQAPTVVTDQLFDHGAGRPLPEDPTASTLLFPTAGGYCLFDGRLGHGVLDSGSEERRATLLVNWWRAKPQNVDRDPAAAAAAADANGSTAAAEGSTDEAELPECVFPRKIEVRESDLSEEGLLMVDDVLSAHGAAAAGSAGVLAVTIEHAGLSLCPLDSEQLRELAGEVRIGAALVPCIPDSASEDGTSSDSDSATSQ